MGLSMNKTLEAIVAEEMDKELDLRPIPDPPPYGPVGRVSR
jgi:hypothetical protein